MRHHQGIPILWCGMANHIWCLLNLWGYHKSVVTWLQKILINDGSFLWPPQNNAGTKEIMNVASKQLFLCILYYVQKAHKKYSLISTKMLGSFSFEELLWSSYASGKSWIDIRAHRWGKVFWDVTELSSHGLYLLCFSGSVKTKSGWSFLKMAELN